MTPPGRLDVVSVRAGGGTIAVPWEARDELLSRHREIGGNPAIVQAFEAVGATRPVELTAEQQAELFGELVLWQREGGMPAALQPLRDALPRGFIGG